MTNSTDGLAAQKSRDTGIMATSYLTIARPPHELILESGEKLGPVTLAYETYGCLNTAKSNAILVLHALSGDAHAAGYHQGADNPGWWHNMIGPGKAFDTDRYFVVCSNVIGGCKGSTGPSSINPQSGQPYGLDFPVISVKDMVQAQSCLLDYLGIDKLLCAAGGSMGGMQVLQWAVSFPERVRAAIPIATAAKHSPQQIAFNEVGRQAIMADPNWNGGRYYNTAPPARGLAVARMIGHITYMSDASMAAKFGRRTQNGGQGVKFSPEFEVEGYLQYRGDNFIKRFDANSYLYITEALDHFDIANGSSLSEVLGKATGTSFLVIAFKSDWLYPAYQSLEIVKACQRANLDVTYCEVNSTYGHDAFLIEIEEEEHLIKHFLRRVSGD
ncbi:MAG: homoserine O-acetyltransferase [Dehalococcoidales bacterium]|nr:homoserine O-acetyltransferase [Dehalococcoidales bacterium]